MPIASLINRSVDWFIPAGVGMERSERVLAQNFVFTHLFGPALSQAIGIFLYSADPDPGFACWSMIAFICLFWTFPLYYKFTGNLHRSALMSVELLAFTSLFGAFFYGGVSSPFLPWLIISLLLGFFYLADKPLTIIGLFSINIFGFVLAYQVWGFPDRLSHEQLSIVGWISILSATIYMSWMAIYYANMTAVRSKLLREVRRHRETEVRLRVANNLAEKANRAKSIFLAKMSHELRTPLNAVIGYSEILLDELQPDEMNRHKKTDLERINFAGKHLLSLLTDVLDLSKIEASQIDLKIEHFELKDLVHEVVATIQPIIASNGNKLIIKCADDLGTVSTDQTKLRQAVINLLSNAAKFTDAGTITLAVQRLRHQVGDWIEVQVRDTGIGIAPSEIDHLFHNFGQADRSIATKYGGTGLGLSLSQTLCALMGGGISVTSEVGKGSCFTIRVLASMSKHDPAEDLDPELFETYSNPITV